MNSHTAVVLMFLLLMIGICTAIYVTESGWWLLAICLFSWESEVGLAYCGFIEYYRLVSTK